jgi:hypothetical protein
VDMTDQIQAALEGLRLAESRGVVTIFAAGPASGEAIRARETGLDPYFGTVTWSAPPSYRAFLALHNGLRCNRTVDVNGADNDYEFDIVDEDEIAELNAELVHQDDQEGRTRYVDSGEWEFPESARPDFPSFVSWLASMVQAFTATEPPEWFTRAGAPGPLVHPHVDT